MRDPLAWVPVKYKLTLTFAFICLVAFGVGGVVVTSTAREALERQISLRLDEHAASTRIVVEHHLNLLGRRSEDFASDGFIRTQLTALIGGDAGAEARLTQHLKNNKLPLVDAFVDASLVDTEGGVRVRSYVGAETVMVDKTSFGPLSPPDAVRSYPSFAVATPLTDISGDRRIGTLVLQVRADVWVEGIAELGSLPQTGLREVSLRDPGGARLQLVGGEAPTDAIAFRETIPHNNWMLRVAVDRAEAMQPIAGLRARFLKVGAILLALTVCVLFFPVRFLLAPLGRIREAARRIAGGDFSARVSYDSKDEIGDLSTAFDIMANGVQQRTHDLEEAARVLRRREADIRVERDRLDAVIRGMNDGLFILDHEGRVTLSNDAAGPLVQAISSDALKPHGGACDADKEERGLDCLHCLTIGEAGGRACAIEVDSRVYEVHVTTLPGQHGRAAGRLCVSRDITQRVAEAELQSHQERMSVLGGISAVMAHELNNPLAAIAMFSQMLEAQLEEGTTARESAEVIRRNAETCKRTIRGLLDTATQQRPDRSAFDLHDLVDDVRRFLHPIYSRASIRFRVDAPEGDCTVVGDELQLRQVLINLVMNAVQAMEDGGRVTVGMRRGRKELEIEVKDTGPGIPEQSAEQIFEPFFTTKPPGVGTGLGLSTSRRIVEAHGGALDLARTGPDGTVFRIRLPRSPQPQEVPSAS